MRVSFRRTRLLALALFLTACSSGLERDLPTLEEAAPPTESVGSLAVTSGSVTVGVVNAIDDAEENGGAVTLSNTALTLGGGTTTALRFQNVGIPKGATVTGAYLEVKAAASTTGTVTLTVRGEAADSPFGYTTAASNVSARTKTAASYAWSPAAWTAGGTYRAHNLQNIVGEIVSRPGWYQGNALALQLTASGTGTRSAVSFNGTPASAPKLVVNFTYDPAVSPAFLSRSLAASSDDAEQPGTAATVLNSTVLEFGQNGATLQAVGLRFPNLTIPPGATINSAQIEVTAAAADSSTASYTVAIEASDSAAPFTTATNNVSGRPKLASPAPISWRPAAHQASTNYRLGQVGPLLQEIVKRPGWRSGNAAAFIVSGVGTAPGTRRAVAFDGTPASAPRLIVSYTPAATPPAPTNPCDALNGTLPAPWTGGDVGTVSAAGKAGSTGGVFDICGYGAGLTTSTDSLQFVRQTLNGDGTLTARLTGLDASTMTARAGVMVRETTAADAKYAALYVGGANARAFVNRGGTVAATSLGGMSGPVGEVFKEGLATTSDQDGSVFEQLRGVAADDGVASVFGGLGDVAGTLSPQAAQLPAPVWLRITRKGTTLSSYTSPDGQTWTPAGTTTLTLAPSVQVGLFSTGQGSTTPATAKFDNVTLGPVVASEAPPVAALTATPTSGTSPLAVTLDGSTSQRAYSYAWDFNAADGVTVEAQGATVTATYTTPYTYTATLTVTDVIGRTSQATAQITVKSANPCDDLSGTLSYPWVSSSVGAVSTLGKLQEVGSSYDLCGSGVGLGSTADSLHFVHQTLEGNGSLTIHVKNLAANAVVGLSARTSLDADADHVSLWVKGKDGVAAFAKRNSGTTIEAGSAPATPSATTSAVNSLLQKMAATVSAAQTSQTPPEASHWLRLTRRGGAFGVFTSADGQNWQNVGTSALGPYPGQFPLGSVEVGFWVAGAADGLGASIDSVSLDAPEGEVDVPEGPFDILLDPWQSAALGAGFGPDEGKGWVGVRNAEALYSLNAENGTDAAPVTEFMYRQERDGDALYVSVSELQTVEADGGVGLMLRDGFSDASSYAFVKVTPQGIVLEKRENGVMSAQPLPLSPHTLPLWLRLDSNGETVTVSQTQNVETWQPVASTQLSLGGARFLGIAAQSRGGKVTGAFTRPRLIHVGDNTLLGTDANHTDVRDDVEHYLKTVYGTNSDVGDALFEVARRAQIMLADPGDNVEVLAQKVDGFFVAKDQARALLGAANEHRLGLLESELFDTLDRLVRSIKFVAEVEQYVLSQIYGRNARPPVGVGIYSNEPELGVAGQSCPTDSLPKYESVFFFVNGMRTGTLAQAQPSLELLADAFWEDLQALDPDTEESIGFELAFTQGLDGDIAEINALKIRENLRENYQINDPWNAQEVLQAYHGRGASQLLTPIQRRVMFDLALAYRSFDDPLTKPDFEDQLEQVKIALSGGKRVFLVGYSEGSLYSNAMKQNLAQDPAYASKLDSLRVMHVGSLASKVEDPMGNDAYVTDRNDTWVWSAENVIAGGDVLPWNVQNNSFKAPWFINNGNDDWDTWMSATQNHSIDFYMSEGSETWRKTWEILKEQFLSTPYQCIPYIPCEPPHCWIQRIRSEDNAEIVLDRPRHNWK